MARRSANATRLAKFLREHGLGYVRKEAASAPIFAAAPNTSDASKAALEAGALNVVEVDTDSSAFNKTVVCTATSIRHARAVADDIAHAIPDAVVRDRREPWVVVDGGSTVYHVLTEEQRERYRPEFVFTDDDPLRREAEKEWAISDEDDKRKR